MSYVIGHQVVIGPRQVGKTTMLHQFLNTATIPYHYISDESRWKAYITDLLIEASISKDVLMMTTIYKPALLKSLFELGCLYSGQILSFTKILGQLVDAGNTTTLSHYLSLLNTAGLLCGLEKYNHKKIKQRSSSPKFQGFLLETSWPRS